MNRIVTAFAVLALASGPAFAKHHASHASKVAQAAPEGTTSTEQQKATVPANADLTGQKIYTSTGNVVGTVSAMGKDDKGQPAAVVGVEKRLGMGSTKVLIAVSQLQPRENGGGYFTSLTLAQVKALPKAP